MPPSQFASSSQPTLKSVWSGGPAKRPARRRTLHTDAPQQNLNASRFSDDRAADPAPANPSEIQHRFLTELHSPVKQTVTEGRGAEAADGAGAPADPISKSRSQKCTDSALCAAALVVSTSEEMSKRQAESPAVPTAPRRGMDDEKRRNLVSIDDPWDHAGHVVDLGHDTLSLRPHPGIFLQPQNGSGSGKFQVSKFHSASFRSVT